MRKITSASPSITQTEIDLVTKAITDGWGDKMSFYIDQFVSEFSAYVGVNYCLPLAHCTDAIHLAMLSLDIGIGDEVIVPDLTWVASAAPITYVGATPIFADIDPVNWCISAESIEQKITSRTKAVVVVDLLGNMPDWEEIIELCQRKGIRIIEDAAEGLGATYKGMQAGSFGEISLFSFSPTKLIMSGQGGAFCTNDQSLYKKAKLLSHHGINKELTSKYFWSDIVGYNYNWTNMQAALALAQLSRIEELIAYKKWLFQEYKNHLGSIEGVTLSSSYKNVEPVNWITVAVVDSSYGLDKENLIEKFSKYNIDTRPMFYPISSMPAFQSDSINQNMSLLNPISYNLSNHSICLPAGNNLSTNDVQYVCDAFKKIIGVK
jgi:perosamine synthetase